MEQLYFLPDLPNTEIAAQHSSETHTHTHYTHTHTLIQTSRAHPYTYAQRTWRIIIAVTAARFIVNRNQVSQLLCCQLLSQLAYAHQRALPIYVGKRIILVYC